MKYIITKYQLNLLNEYIDPIYFLKKKFGKEPRSIKDPKWVPYEQKFQKFVDLIFKLTYRQNKLEHLNGYEVVRVKLEDRWVVLIKPVIDEWFNWKKNEEYLSKLKKFNEEFQTTARMGGFGTPYDDTDFPSEVVYSFWLY